MIHSGFSAINLLLSENKYKERLLNMRLTIKSKKKLQDTSSKNLFEPKAIIKDFSSDSSKGYNKEVKSIVKNFNTQRPYHCL